MIGASSIISQSTRERLEEMIWLLNDLVGDLKTSVDLVNLPCVDMKKPRNLLYVGRLCISSTVISLCKMREIIDHYGNEINSFPVDIKGKLRSVKTEIEQRKMHDFRSQYLAHAFAKKNGRNRPLTLSEGVSAMDVIIDFKLRSRSQNLFRFCEWIYKKGEDDCVVNIAYNTIRCIEGIIGKSGRRA